MANFDTINLHVDFHLGECRQVFEELFLEGRKRLEGRVEAREKLFFIFFLIRFCYTHDGLPDPVDLLGYGRGLRRGGRAPCKEEEKQGEEKPGPANQQNEREYRTAAVERTVIFGSNGLD
ncbi:MAG: hypothetical protein MPW16_14050 [Candidatus Manganitrophus sp.]|nr:MAG: hypothetical protein MPW16_14050 [Candidatus Manganitrophus sp.]